MGFNSNSSVLSAPNSYTMPIAYSLYTENTPMFNNPISMNLANDFAKFVSGFIQLSYNWDGYKASAPKIQTIRQAKKFINGIYPAALQFLVEEDIQPTPYGTIELEFRKNTSYLSVEVGLTKIGFFSDLGNGNRPESGGEPFNNEIPSTLTQAFDQLLSS